MASTTTTLKFFSLVICSLSIAKMAVAGDPDILTDFTPPANGTVDGTFFTYTGLRTILEDEPKNFTVLKATAAEFPALIGQSVSYAVLFFTSGTTNPPHTHPRSAELLFLIGGTLEVGFVDTKNNLFTQTLQPGDMFIFPKGLVHYQYNSDPQNVAIGVSAFGSASAGTVSIPSTLFSTKIDDTVLALSLKTDVTTIQKLKAGFAPKARGEV